MFLSQVLVLSFIIQKHALQDTTLHYQLVQPILSIWLSVESSDCNTGHT